MERKIKIELVDKNHYWMKGIYLLRIGRLRYVGKSVCVGQRAYEHQLFINRTIENYPIWANYGFKNDDERKSYISYMKLIKYLNDNPKIESGTLEVLQRQVCSGMMYFAEDFFLKEIYNDPDCYNTASASTRPSGEQHLWDVEIKDNRIEYFDPRIKHLRVLSTNNSVQNKDIIKKINEVRNSRQYRIDRLMEEKERLFGDNPSTERKGIVLKYILEKMKTIPA